MKSLAIVVMLIVVSLFANASLPQGRVTGSNVVYRDDATLLNKTAVTAVLAFSEQRIENFFVIKTAVVRGSSSEDDLLFVGLPFTGKYYRW